MSDDLVKRLHESGDILRHIEAQAAEITRLRAERDALQAREAKLKRLVQILLDEDPNDMAADAVTVLDVWRKEARAALEGKKDE